MSDAIGFLTLDRVEDVEGSSAYEVAVLVAPDHQGLGVAKAALMLGRQLVPEAVFVAEVLRENIQSREFFSKAGYVWREGHFVSEPDPQSRASESR